MWSEPMTAKELAAAHGWPKNQWRRCLRGLQQMLGPRMTRRLVPVGPADRKKRVVYQFVQAEQGVLWS